MADYYPYADKYPVNRRMPEQGRAREEVPRVGVAHEGVRHANVHIPRLIGRKVRVEEREAGTLKPEQLLPAPGEGAPAASSEGVPTEFIIDVHGESYRVDITGVGVKGDGKRHFYLSLDGMPEEVVFELWH